MACGFSLACGCFVNCFWTVADRFSLSVSRCVSTDCREIQLWPCEQIYDDRRRGEGVSQSDCVLLFLTFWSFRVDHRFSFSVSRCVSTDCRETHLRPWEQIYDDWRKWEGYSQGDSAVGSRKERDKIWRRSLKETNFFLIEEGEQFFSPYRYTVLYFSF